MRKEDRYTLKTVAKIKPIKVFTSCSLKILNQMCSSIFSLVSHLGRKFPILSFNRSGYLSPCGAFMIWSGRWHQDFSGRMRQRRRKWQTGRRGQRSEPRRAVGGPGNLSPRYTHCRAATENRCAPREEDVERASQCRKCQHFMQSVTCRVEITPNAS